VAGERTQHSPRRDPPSPQTYIPAEGPL